MKLEIRVFFFLFHFFIWKKNVDSFDCIDTPQAMMTVKRYSRGPGTSSIGKPAVHPYALDLKCKAYEYVFA